MIALMVSVYSRVSKSSRVRVMNFLTLVRWRNFWSLPGSRYRDWTIIHLMLSCVRTCFFCFVEHALRTTTIGNSRQRVDLGMESGKPTNCVTRVVRNCVESLLIVGDKSLRCHTHGSEH